VNLVIGKSNLILDCSIPDSNPKDTNLYQDPITRIKENYDVQIHDITTNGGYASKKILNLQRDPVLLTLFSQKWLVLCKISCQANIWKPD